MMIPQRLNPELTHNATRSPARRAPSLALCLVGLLAALACKGTIDDNEQSYSLLPNGSGGGASAAPGSGTAAPRTPTGSTTGGDGEQVGGNISGLDNESAGDDRPSGGSRRRAPARERDDDDDDDVDAGVEEPLEDAGVLEDAGIVDGGVLDGGVAADAASAQ